MKTKKEISKRETICKPMRPKRHTHTKITDVP